jgi:hypothetical protein
VTTAVLDLTELVIASRDGDCAAARRRLTGTDLPGAVNLPGELSADLAARLAPDRA